MKINNILIKFYINLIFCLKSISTDCGLPAIPFNAQIKSNQVKHKYDEGDSVEYQCELDGMKLVGPPSRICLKGRWEGIVPRCVEEVDPKIINTIGMAQNNDNTTTLFENRTFVYFGDYKPNECFESKQLGRPHVWGLHLKRAEQHISYFEIEVSNGFTRFNLTEAMSVLKSVKVNDVRQCTPKLMKYSIKTFRINVTCTLEFNINTEVEDWDNDRTQLIELEIDSNEFTICELNIYKTSHRVHHWCGSADVVPYSKRVFIRHNDKYVGNSHYRYTCDQGFKLEGNRDVRCGVDNQWLDEFPRCKPVVICPFEPLNNGTLRHFVHSYHSEGRVRSVVGTIVYYFCEDIPNVLSLMIGDSVRICEADGDWSGVAPICVHDYELYDYLEHFQEINENEKIIDSFEPFNDMLTIIEKEELSCGIPAIPSLGKPITQPQNKRENRHADIRPSYPNSTIISYQCESANVMVSGDISERTCVNGKWLGNVSKCEISFGNKLELTSVIVSHWDEHGELAIEYIDEINSTNLQIVNDNFVFKFDPRKEDQCYGFTIDKKKRLTLRLNETAHITYLQIMLYPGGFFNSKQHVTDPKVLELSPLSAKSNQNQCLLTSAWDYNHSKIGTYFHFSCDLKEQISDAQNNHGDYSEISLDIDPDKFNKEFNSNKISFCALNVFNSKSECGTPDIPMHGSVENTLAQIWTYSCDRDYEIVGPTTVKCGSNGRWMSDFPVCRRKAVCLLNQNKESEGLHINYKNLMTIDGKAVIDSVVNFSCDQSSTTKTLLIGSSIRFCNMFNHYRWSGSEPFCLDPNILTESKTQNNLNAIILPIISIVITFVLIVFIVCFIAFWRRRTAKNENKNVESPYSL